MKFQNEIDTVLRSLQPGSDLVNVMDALEYDLPLFQTAFDIALEMENQNLVKLLYSNYNANKIIVEFTLPGKAANRKLIK